MVNTSKYRKKQDDLVWLLQHALPPGARTLRFARAFSRDSRVDLGRLGVTDAQVTRLERILPAIAHYTQQGPTLAAARRPLTQLADAISTAESRMRSVLAAPPDDEARTESRGRFLESVETIFPNRCPLISPTFHEPRPEDGLPEAQRLASALQDIGRAVDEALKSMPRKQTRPVAHGYPISLIHAALNVDGTHVFNPSASANSPFRNVVGICYEAAGVANADPLRAIRAFVQQRPSKQNDVESGTRKERPKRSRIAGRGGVH